MGPESMRATMMAHAAVIATVVTLSASHIAVRALTRTRVVSVSLACSNLYAQRDIDVETR